MREEEGQEKSGFGKHAPPYLPTEGGSSITQASMIELESSFPLPTEYSTDLAVREREMTNPEVKSFCKPQGIIFNIVDQSLTPPVAGTNCEVLIAGIYNQTAGEHQSIYCHMESYVTVRPAIVTLAISTVPHCHDLPVDDEINQEIALVNAYIQE
ncbi:hypothetical protein J6590_079462 [Homalodisca vitripennis]|nr:hypothetical protein J6590_079462 [Homalodisca vitripennis]